MILQRFLNITISYRFSLFTNIVHQLNKMVILNISWLAIFMFWHNFFALNRANLREDMCYFSSQDIDHYEKLEHHPHAVLCFTICVRGHKTSFFSILMHIYCTVLSIRMRIYCTVLSFKIVDQSLRVWCSLILCACMPIKRLSTC